MWGRRGWLGAPLYEMTGWTVAFTWYAAVVAATVMALPLLVRTARAAIESVDREEIIVLTHRPHLAMALDETLAKLRLDKLHVMAHEVEPLSIALRVLRRLEPDLQSVAWPLLGPHGHSHEGQRLDLIRIVQAVLERDARPQGKPHQHQVLPFPFGP